MAKKSNETTTNYSIIKVTAFWGIIISGFVSLITFVLRIVARCGISLGGAGRLISIFNLIANLALFVSVFLAAYAHSKGKSKTFRILFWIFSIMALLSILGINILGMV